jgi:Fungal Zn(2)-Cys(6) binuclear cluster domain
MSLESSLGVHDGDYDRVKASSSSPEPPDGDKGARHRRNYQACDRCRSRKVKCDLGPVDNPHPPPCARCRRERVECRFAKQRKKEKGDSEERDEEPGSNKRRRVGSGDSIPGAPYNGSFTGYERGNDRVPALDPTLLGMQPPMSYTMRPSPPSANTRPGRGAHEMYRNPNNLEQKSLEVHSSAAGKALTSNPPATTADSLITLQRAAQQLEDLEHDPRKVKDFQRSAAGGPAFAPEKKLTPEQKVARDRCLIVWRSARFVRAGWFTAEEAMLYVEYFYQKLQPMTPVDVTEFRPPGKHLALLTEEPVLAVTILTISSRYMRLTGRSSDTRAHKIHERLWASLMEQIQRLFWGQEQFGGGFTGAGVSKVRESASGQITWPGSLRTLGTIEALLLLSDWQPRSLHFPPDDDDNHLLNLDYDKLPNMTGTNGNAAHNPSLDTLPYASWLEPAWRSDKMCWMLMGLAQALSSELGIDLDSLAIPVVVSAAPDDRRKNRIRRMVQVYVAQISGRNGIPCSIKLPAWEDSVHHAPDSTIDHTQELFVHIASVMNRANREIFPSRQFTRELTKGTEYRKSIATFAPLLDAWMRHFTKVEGFLVEPMRSIILMEYEYARLYINSLGMQNVVDMWMRTDPQMQNSMSSVAKVVSENKRYIHEVTDASVHILEIVSHVLGSGYYLRDAPVRVFLRCLSAMMFALKVRGVHFEILGRAYLHIAYESGQS